jgi:hypothetical protein
MSALGQERTISAQERHVCSTPDSGHPAYLRPCRLRANSGRRKLINHIVSDGYQCWRQLNTKGC